MLLLSSNSYLGSLHFPESALTDSLVIAVSRSLEPFFHNRQGFHSPNPRIKALGSCIAIYHCVKCCGILKAAMAKKIIQVPMDERLLSALNATSKRRGQPRSEFIREACQRYLKQTEYEQMDEVYKEGYERLPEKPALGEVQAVLAGQVLSEESW